MLIQSCLCVCGSALSCSLLAQQACWIHSRGANTTAPAGAQQSQGSRTLHTAAGLTGHTTVEVKLCVVPNLSNRCPQWISCLCESLDCPCKQGLSSMAAAHLLTVPQCTGQWAGSLMHLPDPPMLPCVTPSVTLPAHFLILITVSLLFHPFERLNKIIIFVKNHLTSFLVSDFHVLFELMEYCLFLMFFFFKVTGSWSPSKHSWLEWQISIPLQWWWTQSFHLQYTVY